jgi:hypothetical protein
VLGNPDNYSYFFIIIPLNLVNWCIKLVALMRRSNTLISPSLHTHSFRSEVSLNVGSYTIFAQTLFSNLGRGVYNRSAVVCCYYLTS